MCDRHSLSKDRNLCLMSSLNLKLFLIAPFSPLSKWIVAHPKAYVCMSENSQGVYTGQWDRFQMKMTTYKYLHISETVPFFKVSFKWHWETGWVAFRVRYRLSPLFIPQRLALVSQLMGITLKLIAFTFWLIISLTWCKCYHFSLVFVGCSYLGPLRAWPIIFNRKVMDSQRNGVN